MITRASGSSRGYANAAAQDGWCWFFGAIDHATDELVGWKATKRGDRWAALEPLYQGVRYAFGRGGKDVARGLTVRTDWGPQYTAHAFGAELRWLGIQHSPSFVGEPQCNGVIERFMRTLKEQCQWLHRFTELSMPSGKSRRSSSATTRNGSSSATGIARRGRFARS